MKRLRASVIHLVRYSALGLLVGLAAPSWGQAVVGDFEGNLNGSVFGQWSADHTLIDDSVDAAPGILTTEFFTDDPSTTVSEGVTLGSQSLVVEHLQWEFGFKPYLSLGGGNDLAQAILDSDSFEIDLTPIVPETGWDPELSWRQAFLAFSYDGIFGRIQRDYEHDLNAEGEPLPDTLFWNLNQFVGNDNDPTDVRTWKGWAQNAIDTEQEFDLFLIFQGRDIDANGALQGFNPFFPTSSRTAVDNARFNGLVIQEPLPGDYNSDGIVNAADYAVFRESLGADTLANRDPAITGPVGQADFDAWVANFGATAPAAAAALAAGVPEPTSLGLLLLSAGLLHGRRFRRASL